MDALDKALEDPNLKSVLLAAVAHAETRIRKYVWRGKVPGYAKPGQELMAGDKTSRDFVNEAISRLFKGSRTYNPEQSLLKNLTSIIDSLIWSDKISSDRSGIIDFDKTHDEADDSWNGLLNTACDDQLSADKLLQEKEYRETQRKFIQKLKASFDNNKDIREYLDALDQGYFKIDDISEITSIPIPKIYEIRRKLKTYASRIFGVTNFADLERKMEINDEREN